MTNAEYKREWRRKDFSKNPEKYRGYARAWKKTATGRKSRSRSACERIKRKLASDPKFKLLFRLRNRVWYAARGLCKSARTRELLGCTVPEWHAHLESLFKPGMTWENYGPVWHVDHIKPLSLFDMADPIQRRVGFHWSNTQPLFKAENLKKNDTYE